MSLLKLIKHEHGENFKEEIDNIRMNKSGFKNRVTEMKNTLNAINSGLDQTKEQITNMEDRVMEITQSDQPKEKKNILPKYTEMTLGTWKQMAPTSKQKLKKKKE